MTHAMRQVFAGAGQAEPAGRPVEQRGAEFQLQRLDALAHRALRDEQLVRCFSEAQPPGGDLEYAQ